MKISGEILSEINCLQEKDSKDFLTELIVFEKSIIFKQMPQYQDKINRMISKYVLEKEDDQTEAIEEVISAKD